VIDEPEPGNQAATANDHAPTLAAIGVLAFIATILAHEALGHGGGCIAIGGHAVLHPVSMQCTVVNRATTAAGPLMNFVVGTGLWVLLRVVRSWSPRLRYFLWITMAFNWFLGAGYLLLGGVAGFGDWPIVFQNSQPPWLWRVIAVPLAAVMYYIFMRKTASTGPEYLWPAQSAKGALAHTLFPYLAAGCVACAAAAFSPFGMRYVLLAAAASLGDNCGLVVIRDWGAAAAVGTAPIPRVTRSFAWITAALVVAAFFILCIGPGLHVPL
jgi:hypothetical protein